jgi:hypothetical protein
VVHSDLSTVCISIFIPPCNKLYDLGLLTTRTNFALDFLPQSLQTPFNSFTDYTHTHTLTHSLTHTLTHSLTHSHTHTHTLPLKRARSSSLGKYVSWGCLSTGRPEGLLYAVYSHTVRSPDRRCVGVITFRGTKQMGPVAVGTKRYLYQVLAPKMQSNKTTINIETWMRG